MAQRDSPLFSFITDALMDNKYPGVLFWIDRNEGIFCLKCLCKSNRKWTASQSKIFDDYHNLKPRRSNDKRQRFLVAMRACPFIEPLDDKSSKEEKFYKFKTHGTSSVDATDEIAALSASNVEVETGDIPMPEMGPKNGFPPAEHEPPPGDTIMEDNAIGNDLGTSLSPMLLADSNDSLFEALGGESQVEELLQRLELAVPDEAANIPEYPGMGDSPSLYDETVNLMRSAPSCSQALDSSDPWNLPGEELSYHFEMKEENGDIPPDYDPLKDFLESMGTPKPAEATSVDPSVVPRADPNQLGSVQTIPVPSGESSNCQSVKIVRLDDNDGIVRSLRGDNPEKKYFMMVLTPGM